MLEAAFRAPLNEAVRRELNALRRNQVTGHDLLHGLDRIYHRHHQREANARRGVSLSAIQRHQRFRKPNPPAQPSRWDVFQPRRHLPPKRRQHFRKSNQPAQTHPSP